MTPCTSPTPRSIKDNHLDEYAKRAIPDAVAGRDVEVKGAGAPAAAYPFRVAPFVFGAAAGPCGAANPPSASAGAAADPPGLADAAILKQ